MSKQVMAEVLTFKWENIDKHWITKVRLEDTQELVVRFPEGRKPVIGEFEKIKV